MVLLANQLPKFRFVGGLVWTSQLHCLRRRCTEVGFDVQAQVGLFELKQALVATE